MLHDLLWGHASALMPLLCWLPVIAEGIAIQEWALHKIRHTADMAYSRSRVLWQAVPTNMRALHQVLRAAALSASSPLCCCTPTVPCALQEYLANAFRSLLLTKEGKAAKPLAVAGVC